MTNDRLLRFIRTERRRLAERRQCRERDEHLCNTTNALVLVQADRIAELENELATLKLKLRYGKVG